LECPMKFYSEDARPSIDSRDSQPAQPPSDLSRSAEAWVRRADELVEWALANLNRDDAHGRYYPRARRKKGQSQYTAKKALSPEQARRHFRGEDGQTVGIHSTNPDHTSKWLLLDIDAHDGQADPEANLRYALAKYELLRSLGFHPLLTYSNGGGGYHLRVSWT